jgi:glycosyltransferase involved in cell wall biosynthesis
MKVLVVSSYPPRHCGIGAYARDQVAALRADGHEVTVLSPPDGEGDLRTSFFSGSPFFRAARVARGFDRIVVHFQPGLYYRRRAPVSKVMASFGLLWLALRAGPRLDVLVHEADPPTLWRPDYALLRLAFRTARRVTFHTEAERKALEAGYRVRVRAAVDAFAGTRAGDGRLYVVGSVRQTTQENLDYARSLAERCRMVEGVTLVNRYLSDEEFDLWVAAADWLVLPYRRSWSSGVLARAHALGTPSIVAATGGLSEQAEEGDVIVHDDDELREAMDRSRAMGSQERG